MTVTVLSLSLLSSCGSGGSGYPGAYRGQYDPIPVANNRGLAVLGAAYAGQPLRYPANYRHPQHNQYMQELNQRAARGRSIRVPSNYGNSWYPNPPNIYHKPTNSHGH